MPDGLQSSDLRVALLALRDLLVDRILGAEVRETAPLAKQLADVLVRLDGLGGEEKSKLDDLADRRARRVAGLQDEPASTEQRR